MEWLFWDLKHRGLQPEVVYVDDECCGAWKRILENIWPGIAVRLDGLHAIKRLTRTTTSSKHPWYNQFCSLLSSAIYSYDELELERLRNARSRAGLSDALPKGLKSKHVPRIITNAENIFEIL